MFSPDYPSGYEARKCKHRVAAVIRGHGLDLTNDKEKIHRDALWARDLPIDMSADSSLGMFSDAQFDYVFDAHQLGNFVTPMPTLAEWWRVVNVGGHLVLYEQDPDYYPRVGTPGSSDKRKNDMYWEEAWEILKSFGNAELVSATRHNESNEYSWQLVVKKVFDNVKRVVISGTKKKGCVFPRKKVTGKEALVIRLGALGDTLWITPVLRKLKEDGYHVAVNCTSYGAQVIEKSPWVDEFIVIDDTKNIQYERLEQYWEMIGESFDKVINLTKSVEASLLAHEGDPQFNWPHEKRHEAYNFNFQDRTMELAGYPDAKGEIPHMHFTDIEEYHAKIFRTIHKDNFLLVWGLAGSAFHKVYPWAEYVANEFVAKHSDVRIITVGGGDTRQLEWQNKGTINKAGVFSVRQSFILAKYADLVVGPDTGLLNAASCWNTPKIIFMSANTKENLTKYWKNCTELTAEDCECYPCHRLIYHNICPRGTLQGVAPKCCENIQPEKVMEAIEKVYEEWRYAKLAKQNSLKVCAFTIADSDLTHRLANRVKKSFEKFHDHPFYIFDARDEEKIFGDVKVAASACQAFAIRPRLQKKLLEDYDLVIYLDGDTVVCDKLTEFLEGDFDVAGSLNLGEHTYLNAGVNACTSKKFSEEWESEVYKPDCKPSNQISFNCLAFSGKYKLKIVDEKDVYYNERSRPYWKDLKVVGGKLWCNGRQVKVLHWAGGVGRMEEKLSSSDFSPDVRAYLNGITDTTDFTDVEGQEVSGWDR